MSAPDPHQPSRPDEALEIMRRLEPMLSGIQADIKDMKAGQQHLGERLASLEGRVSHPPTFTPIIGAVLSANAGIVAAAFGLVNVLRPL